mmetsp:Transcript_20544/g.71104  ORF Transcript_20544/g.71104 Transcript_20544/m.71104 type:complete len:200 (+) Transcript_20544:159-758(+)
MTRRSSDSTFSRAFSSLKVAPSFSPLSCWASNWRLTSSICSSTAAGSRSMAASFETDSTASFARSSSSTLGRTTLRNFWKPSTEVICLSVSSGVPWDRMSESMTANFCFADSTTTASGSAMDSFLPSSISRTWWSRSWVLSSSLEPTVFSTSCWSSASVRPARIFDANASSKGGSVRTLTCLIVTSKAALTPARGCTSR